MKTVLKFGLIAAGAYLLARQFGVMDGAAETPPAEAPPEEAPPEEAPPEEAPPQEAPPQAPTLLDLLKAASGINGRNFDEWNYYYKELTDRPGPAPEDVGITRTDPMPLMTAEEWAAKVTAGGFQL